MTLTKRLLYQLSYIGAIKKGAHALAVLYERVTGSCEERVEADEEREELIPNRPFGVLHNRSFLLLWIGLLVSSAGDWVNYIAMVSLVFQQTHSALMLAVLRLFHIVP